MPTVAAFCRQHLLKILPLDAQLVEICQTQNTPKKLRYFGIHSLTAINQCTSDTVFLCEWDCLYPPEYFDRKIDLDYITIATPGVYLLRQAFTPAYMRRHRLCSGSAVGSREKLRAAFEKVVDENCQFPQEPRKKQKLSIPWVDIRHEHNATKGEKKKDRTFFSELPYWGPAANLWAAIGAPTWKPAKLTYGKMWKQL
jgi:hypothetical protein